MPQRLLIPACQALCEERGQEDRNAALGELKAAYARVRSYVVDGIKRGQLGGTPI